MEFNQYGLALTRVAAYSVPMARIQSLALLLLLVSCRCSVCQRPASILGNEEIVQVRALGKTMDEIGGQRAFPHSYPLVEVAETPGPPSPQGVNGVEILSDTQGINFDVYVKQVMVATKKHWYPLIPESARPPSNKKGSVAIKFKIYPDGHAKEMLLETPSGDISLDRAAWGGISDASPYPPLPEAFKGPYLELRLNFFYNLNPAESIARP